VTIPEYSLPRATPSFVEQLLAALLGPGQGKKVFDGLAAQLLESIRSGYDVHLLAEMVRANETLPRDRMGLYAAALNQVNVLYDDSRYPVDVISSIAWDRWRKGERLFQQDKNRLTDNLLPPLMQAKIIAPQGGAFAFCHDLMRGYLAACWVVKHAVSIDESLERLSDIEIWKLCPEDHDVVFPFLAALEEEPINLTRLAQFALKDLSHRIRLLQAVKEVAQAKGWSLAVNL
jgi:hypothetical protein